MKNQFQSDIQYRITKWFFLLLLAGYGSLMLGEITVQDFETVDHQGYPVGMMQNHSQFEADSSNFESDYSERLHVEEISAVENKSLKSHGSLAWGEISNVLP
ncbi:MAG: hypothetical protein R3220_09340 [Balneolaceae bacterium]|nr:hypothetical protein [Balneolaceae bacterium]